MEMRTAYRYSDLSEKSKKVAAKLFVGHDLNQYHYNLDGTYFENSTEVHAYEKKTE